MVGIALAGDSSQVMRLTHDLSQRFPKDTLVQSEYLPMIHAANVLGRGNASREADKAIETLVTAAPYGLGADAALYPAYLRGEAYLAAHQGGAAAAELQKILDHPGVVVNEPSARLAPLGLGRVYALEAGVGAGLVPALSPSGTVPAQAGRPQGAPLANVRFVFLRT
jgi:eukaryotic-like serine/threonine-protein kinase